MAKKSNINPDQIREAIDAVDDQLLQLFQKRMTFANYMAEYKTVRNAPIYNKEREDAIITNVFIMRCIIKSGYLRIGDVK